MCASARIGAACCNVLQQPDKMHMQAPLKQSHHFWQHFATGIRLLNCLLQREGERGSAAQLTWVEVHCSEPLQAQEHPPPY